MAPVWVVPLMMAVETPKALARLPASSSASFMASGPAQRLPFTTNNAAARLSISGVALGSICPSSRKRRYMDRRAMPWEETPRRSAQTSTSASACACACPMPLPVKSEHMKAVSRSAEICLVSGFTAASPMDWRAI